MFICVYLTRIWKKSTLMKLRGELRQLPPPPKIHTNYFSETFRYKANIPQWKKICLTKWVSLIPKELCHYLHSRNVSWLNSEKILTRSLPDKMLIEAVPNDKRNFSLSPNRVVEKSLGLLHLCISSEVGKDQQSVVTLL